MTAVRSKAAEDRAAEAWDQRYKHAKAASTWDAVADESGPGERREISKILATWMAAYAYADAIAERAFTGLFQEPNTTTTTNGGIK